MRKIETIAALLAAPLILAACSQAAEEPAAVEEVSMEVVEEPAADATAPADTGSPATEEMMSGEPAPTTVPPKR